MKDNIPMLIQTQQREAPWNQEMDKPVEVDCSVCYCMSKTMPVWVENYDVSEDASSSLYDDGKEYSFDNTNFIQEFENDGKAMGIPTLLEELQKLCWEKIRRLRDELEMTYISNNERRKARKEMAHYLSVLNASGNWIVDDLDVIKED